MASPSNRLLRDRHGRRVVDAVSGRGRSRASTGCCTGRRLGGGHGRRVVDAVSGRGRSRAGTGCRTGRRLGGGHVRRVVDAVSGRGRSRAGTGCRTGRRLGGGHGRRVVDAVPGRGHSRAGMLAGEDLGHLDVRRAPAGKRIAADEHAGYENQDSNNRRASHPFIMTPLSSWGHPTGKMRDVTEAGRRQPRRPERCVTTPRGETQWRSSESADVTMQLHPRAISHVASAAAGALLLLAATPRKQNQPAGAWCGDNAEAHRRSRSARRSS